MSPAMPRKTRPRGTRRRSPRRSTTADGARGDVEVARGARDPQPVETDERRGERDGGERRVADAGFTLLTRPLRIPHLSRRGPGSGPRCVRRRARTAGAEGDRERIDAGAQQQPVEAARRQSWSRARPGTSPSTSGKASMISRKPRATTIPSRSWDRMSERTKTPGVGFLCRLLRGPPRSARRSGRRCPRRQLPRCRALPARGAAGLTLRARAVTRTRVMTAAGYGAASSRSRSAGEEPPADGQFGPGHGDAGLAAASLMRVRWPERDEVRAVDAHERRRPTAARGRTSAPDEVARLLGVQPRVVALRLHVAHLVAADHPGGAAERHGDHLGLGRCRGAAVRRRP